MMKSFLKVATTVFMTVSAFVVADCHTTFEFGVGYRRDDINWNRGNHHDSSSSCESDLAVDTGSSDGRRTKLRLEDMDIFLINAKARSLDECYYFRVSGDYGWITDGKISRRDQNLFADNDSFSNRRKINGNYVADVSLAIGYPFIMGCCNEFTVAPIIGYGWSQQQITTKRRNSTCSDNIIDFPCQGRDKLRFTWYAPYIGVDLFYALDDCWNVYGEFEYHFLGQAKRRFTDSCANIVIGSDEVSCSHNNKSKHAQGFVGEIGATYAITCDWYAGLAVDLKYWSSKSGGNKNHLKWTSWGLNANLGYVF